MSTTPPSPGRPTRPEVPPRQRLRAFSAWLALLTAGSLGLIGCTALDHRGTTGPTSMPSAGASHAPVQSAPLVTSSPLETVQSSELSPVYFLGENGRNIFLYREFRQAEDMGDPITTAVSAMTRLKPRDPDYFNPWSPAAKVGASIMNGSVITLDISSDAFKANVDEGIAERAVQQLVYTATAAAANAGLTTADNPLEVVVLVDGHTGYMAFRHVRLGAPMSRDYTLAAPVWIIDPQEGDTAADQVRVLGRGVAFESQLSWQIYRLKSPKDTGAGELAESGTVPISAPMGQAGEFEFTQQLDPGSYRLYVYHEDMSGRTQERQNPDSKVFTIR
ncbi:GerMN domain-containing protein [Arthrobacter sp. I2-34]|uniref:GerMN domain-containing protein n=1 Tax=Arthrobacter hankyongi TaxID=2904801 RepID=A0ABS9L6W9_9MICC|nr:Gmad2 immunoglobulin-like domain-containing protein [Arthrobacter hankyongi]MCG2622229.1 GerMN domain-containing protein [Arthrobacter hankyongi]